MYIYIYTLQAYHLLHACVFYREHILCVTQRSHSMCYIENTFYVLHRRTKRWSQQCASQSQGSWPYIENKVGHCLFFFQAHQRLVTTMRIIGGGFVAMTFDSEFTCQKARDQVFVCLYVSFLCMQVSFQCMQVSFDTI